MSFSAGVNAALDNTKQETEIGIGKFRLFAKVKESTNYKSTVPIDVLEDGSNSTDDILNEPITVSITGVVGDLFIEEKQYPELVSKDFSSVGSITSLLPAQSQQQLQRVTQINDQLRSVTLQLERAERIAGNAYEFFNNSASESKSEQDKFIEYMETIHFSRQPITLSTNRRDFKNMAMSNLVIDEDNETGVINFVASFTQINYLELVYTTVSAKFSSPSSAVSGKTSDAANKGGQNPETNTETSLLGSLLG